MEAAHRTGEAPRSTEPGGARARARWAAQAPARPAGSEGVPGRKRWALLPRARWAVQLYFAGTLVVAAVEFAAFHRQAMAGEALTAHRPPSVEGFLPISALLALRQLLVTGEWDAVHPAGLTILLAAIAGSLLARRAFCSWICPVGTLSRGLEWLGQKLLGRHRRETLVPAWLDGPLSGLKYALLAYFVWTIFVAMPFDAVVAFLQSPYNLAADAKMLRFFLDLSGLSAAILAALVLLSVFVKNAWCRYLCPYGALLGLGSALSPQRVVRDPATCTDCRACTRACPMEIRVHARSVVITPECTGCLECVASCPQADCLAVGRRGRKGWPATWVPVLGVGALVVAWALAAMSGFWYTAVPLDVLARMYRL